MEVVMVNSQPTSEVGDEVKKYHTTKGIQINHNLIILIGEVLIVVLMCVEEGVEGLEVKEEVLEDLMTLDR